MSPAATADGHSIRVREVELPTWRGRWFPQCSCGWTGTAAKTKKEAVYFGTHDHADLMKPPPPPCPTPDKKRFKTQDKAEAELELFWRTAAKGKKMPCRTYLCDCGYWHVTARPLRESRTA